MLTEKTWLLAVIVFSLVFGLFSGAFAVPVGAESSRIAIVADVKGDVFVTKAGGVQPFRAFKQMGLNRGDHLTTGIGASVVLQIADRNDEVTIGENSSLYIAELKNDGEGKKTRLKIWVGSLWVKAKSLFRSQDEFEVETPTAVMGIRGTQFGVTVSGGDTTITVGAGIVQAGVYGSATTAVYPFMQAFIPAAQHREEAGQSVSVRVAPFDLAKFVETAPVDLIAAIIRNELELRAENNEFIAAQKQEIEQGRISQAAQQMGIDDLDGLLKLAGNLTNFVGNIVNEAVATEKLDPAKALELIADVNEHSDFKLDLGDVQPFTLTEKQEKMQNDMREAREAAEKQAEAEREKERERRREFDNQRQRQVDDKAGNNGRKNAGNASPKKWEDKEKPGDKVKRNNNDQR